MNRRLDRIIAPQVLRDAHAHGHAFVKAEPFRHVVIDDFFAPAYLDRVDLEFPSFERGSALTENGDLGNKSTVEKIRDLGASFAALDDLIQSKDFLDLVGRLTGIDGLLYDPWYFGGGTHESRHGQDLDAHVDFNRHPIENWHRRLNLIVYLNHEWDDDWGGALELHSDPRAADNRTMRITPRSNRCVIFETTESSWHGFPPIVLPESKRHLTRRSIALYFYTKERPAEELADTHSTIYIDRPLPERFREGHTLDHDDVHELRILLARRDRHIQRLYRDVSQANAQFEAARNSLANMKPFDVMMAMARASPLRKLVHRMRWFLRKA
jgi:hypothetical protein